MFVTVNQMKYIRDLAKIVLKTKKPEERPKWWREWEKDISLFVRGRVMKIDGELVDILYNYAVELKEQNNVSSGIRSLIDRMEGDLPYIYENKTEREDGIKITSIRRFMASLSNDIDDEDIEEFAQKGIGNYILMRNSLTKGYMSISSISMRHRKGEMGSVIFVERTKTLLGSEFRCGGVVTVNDNRIYLLSKLRREADIRLKIVRAGDMSRPTAMVPMPGIILGVSGDGMVFATRILLVKMQKEKDLEGVIGTWKPEECPEQLGKFIPMLSNGNFSDETLGIYGDGT